jgi:hypothetical protein
MTRFLRNLFFATCASTILASCGGGKDDGPTVQELQSVKLDGVQNMCLVIESSPPGDPTKKWKHKYIVDCITTNHNPLQVPQADDAEYRAKVLWGRGPHPETLGMEIEKRDGKFFKNYKKFLLNAQDPDANTNSGLIRVFKTASYYQTFCIYLKKKMEPKNH